MDKRIATSLACAVATLATMGVAHSRLGGQAMKGGTKTAMVVTVNAKSAAAAKRLLAYVKGSGNSYYLESADARGKVSKVAKGKISVGDIRLAREKIFDGKTPGPVPKTCPLMWWGDKVSLVDISRTFASLKDQISINVYQKGAGSELLGKQVASFENGKLQRF